MDEIFTKSEIDLDKQTPQEIADAILHNFAWRGLTMYHLAYDAVELMLKSCPKKLYKKSTSNSYSNKNHEKLIKVLEILEDNL